MNLREGSQKSHKRAKVCISGPQIAISGMTIAARLAFVITLRPRHIGLSAWSPKNGRHSPTRRCGPPGL